MPNIIISNYSPFGRDVRQLAILIRKACLDMHATIPELGKWEPKDLAVNLGGATLFNNDRSPIQIVVDVIYKKPERTREVLQRFAALLHATAKACYPKQDIEVTIRPPLDTSVDVVFAG